MFRYESLKQAWGFWEIATEWLNIRIDLNFACLVGFFSFFIAILPRKYFVTEIIFLWGCLVTKLVSQQRYLATGKLFQKIISEQQWVDNARETDKTRSLPLAQLMWKKVSSEFRSVFGVDEKAHAGHMTAVEQSVLDGTSKWSAKIAITGLWAGRARRLLKLVFVHPVRRASISIGARPDTYIFVLRMPTYSLIYESHPCVYIPIHIYCIHIRNACTHTILHFNILFLLLLLSSIRTLHRQIWR